jgi:hypothetical protein
MRLRKSKCRIGYRVVFSGKYKGLADSDEVFVDSQDNNDVLYLFHVYMVSTFQRLSVVRR